MNAHERASATMIDAEKLGCDTPTESMIADAINDAEEDVITCAEISLKQHGFAEASALLERWRQRRDDTDFPSENRQDMP